MYQSVLPNSFRNAWFNDRPQHVEIDWRNPLTRGLYGCWLLGNGPPTNLVRVAPNGTGSIVGNFGHGSYSGVTPGNTVDVHGPASNWTGAGGIDLSVPSAFSIERTEALTFVAFLNVNVLRSGGALDYTIWANTGDSVNKEGIRFQLDWSTTTALDLVMTNTPSTNQMYAFQNSDVANGAAVLGAIYTGNSHPSGVTFYESGTFTAATSFVDTLTASILPATPIPAIGRRTVGGAVLSPYRGTIMMLFLWRGRALSNQEVLEVDLNPQQMFLVPSYRRWFIPPAAPTATVRTLLQHGVGV